MYYYCDSITGSLVRWQLIESFQSGSLVRATLTQEIAYSHFYIPVSDKKVVTRLRRRLADYRKITSRTG